MKKLLAALCLVPSLAMAQSSPDWPVGYTPSVAEIESEFASKADLGGIVPATGGTYTGLVSFGAGLLVGPCSVCVSTVWPALYSDANTTLVLNGSGAATTPTALVIEGPPPGTVVGDVIANLAINRVSGANEEHLNFLSLVSGNYSIGQIVTGTGSYHPIDFGKSAGTPAFTINTSNGVDFKTPVNFSNSSPITATGNLALEPANNIVVQLGTNNQFYATTNSSLGSDLKSWVTGQVSGQYYLASMNDAQNAFTKAYSIGRGTTYNVANHTWYTSTVAGTPVQGMQLSTSGLEVDVTITSPTNLLFSATNNIVGQSGANNQFYSTTNSTLGADLKSWVTANVSGQYYVGAMNDAQNGFTKAYAIGRGTTYNVASHTWYTSTVAGTPVQGLTLTTAVLGSAVPVQLPVSTVAALPTCAAGIANSMAAVSDATAPTYNAALTGGGAVHIPVFCDGSAWKAH